MKNKLKAIRKILIDFTTKLKSTILKAKLFFKKNACQIGFCLISAIAVILTLAAKVFGKQVIELFCYWKSIQKFNWTTYIFFNYEKKYIAAIICLNIIATVWQIIFSKEGENEEEKAVNKKVDLYAGISDIIINIGLKGVNLTIITLEALKVIKKISKNKRK